MKVWTPATAVAGTVRVAAALAVAGLVATTAPAQGRPEARPGTLATSAAPEAAVTAPAVTTPVVAPQPPTRGPETNLPLPRYVSLKVGEGNARRGPSLSHRIDWVFLRRDMPLQVVSEYGHWRRVLDREGLGGWLHYSLLSGVRTVIVDQPMLELHLRPDRQTPVTARLEQGVIARLGACERDWCRLTAEGHRGWAPKIALWGVSAEELRD